MTIHQSSPYRPFGTLRFVLALMVVVGHALQLAGGGLLQALHPWGLGNVAVMVFFVLSGFIISEAMDLFYRGRVGKFLINRALRIVPPYLVALVASVAIHFAVAQYGELAFFDYDEMPSGTFDGINLLSNLLSIAVLYGLGHLGLQPDYLFVRYLWAVRVEVHFYLVFALLCWLVWRGGRLARPLGRAGPPAAFVGATVLLIVLFVLEAATRSRVLNYFQFAPYFLLGVCMFHGLSYKNRWALAGIGISLCLSVFHFVGYVGRSADAAVLGPTVLLVALIGLIVPLSRSGAIGLWRSVDRSLGDLSYSLYLNHYVVTIAFLSLARTPSLGLFAGCLGACVVFSWAMALLTEPVTRRIRDRLRGVAL